MNSRRPPTRVRLAGVPGSVEIADLMPPRPRRKAAESVQASNPGPLAAGVVSEAMRGLSERRFQRFLVAALRSRGWRCWIVPDMRKTLAGLPDVLAWHPDRPGRLLAWELKTATGKPTATQAEALAHLRTVPGIDARVCRPADWESLMQEADR